DELTEKELKQIEADDQAIQTILLGLHQDIYAAVDSCETAQEIWLRVQQMMKGSDIGIQEKKAKLFNEWESNVVNENVQENVRNVIVNGNRLRRFCDKIGLLWKDKAAGNVGSYPGEKICLLDINVPIEESKVYSNQLVDDNEINSDELESHVESNFVESLSNHDALIDLSQKFDHLDEFSGPLMPIHIAEEERIKRERAEYISRIEMLFTINPCLRLTVNANTIVESFLSSLIPIHDNVSQREEIDIVTNTDELLPPGFENDDSEGEINAVDDLHVNISISNSENELSDNEESDFDNCQFHDLLRNHQILSLILS
nr:ribonuclease H-like domain-containing protein [Tanacetum cinerariifolium]